eukprot:2557145-Alexandrium_andersonii.AAC.1
MSAGGPLITWPQGHRARSATAPGRARAWGAMAGTADRLDQLVHRATARAAKASKEGKPEGAHGTS